MYFEVKFGINQSHIFVGAVRSKQLIAHIKVKCCRDYRRALASLTANIRLERAEAQERAKKIKLYLDNLETAPSDKAEDQESKSENEKNRQQLVKESNELDTAQKSFDFQEQKIQEAQQLLAENGTMDLVMNSMMMYLNEAKDNYANEPVEKGAISIPLESKKVYYLLHRETEAHGPVPMLLPLTPSEEKDFANTFKIKNLPKK
jgi:hypothetical protein